LETDKNNKLLDIAWDFLASIKLAIVIFALISLTSIVGTVLEQQADPSRNIQIMSKLFGDSLGPTLFTVFDKLGFTDMYHSWWFIGLLIFFAVNLVVCSLERLPRIWKLAREPINPMTEEQLRKFPILKEMLLKGNPDKIRDSVVSALTSTGYKCAEIREDKGYQFFTQKGSYSRLGVYITHFSILFILIGAILGIKLGFNGFLNLPEGAVSNVAFSGMDKELPLGFDIRCDNFEVDFYGRSDMPKEYRSWLTIIKDGKEVLKKSIVVNDPLTYDGITFYQASFGLVPDALEKGIFIFKVISKDGQSADLKLKLGDSFQIPGTNTSGKIIDFSPALKIDAQGHAFTFADQMYNPAVYIEFAESGKQKFSGWLLKRQPETWQLPDGNRVEFLDIWGVEFTGLQVRKDPGVWVVYFGCIAMSIGLFIAFFMSHRKLWVKIMEDKNNTKVLIGATANKNRASFERKIDKMVSSLNKKLAGGK